MKKRYMSIACMALGITLLATGCKKDEVKDTFNLNAVIEEVNGGQKVHMENALPVWDNNDTIRVNNENCTVSITGTGANRKNSIAKQVEENTYCAFYPASYLDANTNITNHSGIWITLPQRQDYIVSGVNQTVRMPMIAYSNTTDLHFKNLCSVLKVTVTNTTGHTFKLDSIQVKCDNSNLWGRCSVSLGGYTSVSTPAGMSGLISGGKVVTLCGANKTSMNESFADRAVKTFYIVVPTVSRADTFRIRLGIEEGFLVNKKTPGEVTVDRNKLISLGFSATDFEQPIDVIIGPFSVSDTSKVSFSTGNLWYSRSDKGGDGKFHFEAQQYYYKPTSDIRNEEHISYFWWSKQILGYQDYPTNQPASSDYLFTNKENQPTMANPNFIVENVKGKFRTLSMSEWNYLISGRYSRWSWIGSAVVELTDVIAWGSAANLNLHPRGLVILPDQSTVDPRTCTTTVAVKNAGAVFLPIAGSRVNPYDGGWNSYNDCWYNHYYDLSSFSGDWGDYWTSDHFVGNDKPDKAHDFAFTPAYNSGTTTINYSIGSPGMWAGTPGNGEGTRDIGRTMRLVCKYAGN